MRKRAALAQALLGAPELVLLDEPTAGVDPPNVRVIHALVRELAGAMDFVVSSHNLDELERLTERVVYLERGRVSTRGELAEGGAGDGRLTVLLERGPGDDEAGAAFGSLSEVSAASPGPRGAWALEVADADAAAAAVLALCAERGWRWRSLARGRSLEERLYGDGAG